jgi:DNA-binding NarL/FixJ family response regulator
MGELLMNIVKSHSLHAASKAAVLSRPVETERSLHGAFGKTNGLALINPRNLERECFVRSMETAHPQLDVAGYGSIREWKDARDRAPADVILYNIGGRSPTDQSVAAELARLVEDASPTPVIVLAESEDLREMIAAVDAGARGYIPASIGIDVMMEATRLTAAGGVFLPVTSILSMRETIAPKPVPTSGIDEYFTSRQASVADALRRGKANKIIAYELNMCESTVKVHIRNIMKKLKATNRTEAAFKLNALFPTEGVETR